VQGLRRVELDPSGWVVKAMQRVGLAWNVVEITPERQQQKLATAPQPPPRAQAA
jgi:stearoyl-CoA desaturase (delta-9 desaturase)